MVSRPSPLCVRVLPEGALADPALVRGADEAGLVWAVGDQPGEVVLLDLRIPGAEAVWARWRGLGAAPATTLPVVAVVESLGFGDVERLRRLGITDFVRADAPVGELGLRVRRARAQHAAEQEGERRQKDLSFLLKLTADYAGSLDTEALLHDVTRMLAEELLIDRAALVVLDEHRDVGFIVAASDDAGLKDLRIELSRYPEIREVVRTGKPVIVEDAPSHPLLEGVKAEVAARGIWSLAAVPLSASGKVLGVLLVRASDKRKAFTRREIDFLSTVAHATAIALRNARVLESVRGETEKEKHARIAAEELAAELKRYESYFEHVSEGVAILDEKGAVLTLNPAGAALLEVPADAARGRRLSALTQPGEDARVSELLRRAAQGEVVRTLEVRAQLGGGQPLILSLSAAPLGGTGGAVILSFRDVTQARQLADALQKTNEFLQRLIDSSVDAIIAADLSGRIILFNKGAEAICGYTAEEAMGGLNVRELYPEGVARQIMKRLRDPFTDGGSGRLGVTRQEIVTRAGERVPVNMTASIVYEQNREVATLGIFTDIRERMKLEQKLSAAEDRLSEAEKNAVIVALAGTAAHELNQPLTSVMGYAELLRRKLQPSDPAFRPVDIIYREAERMAEIVRKIGKITRYETKAYIGTAQILDLDKATSHEE